MRYSNELASTAANLQAVGLDGNKSTLEEVLSLVKSLQEGIAALEASMRDGDREAADYCHSVLPAMNAVRATVDALEGVVADDLWPLPTYQEMLFIR
jgi:glutamine synthetase